MLSSIEGSVCERFCYSTLFVCVRIGTESGRRGNYPRGSSPVQYDSRSSSGRGGGSQGSRLVRCLCILPFHINADLCSVLIGWFTD